MAYFWNRFYRISNWDFRKFIQKSGLEDRNWVVAPWSGTVQVGECRPSGPILWHAGAADQPHIGYLTFDGWAVGIGHIFCGQERSFSAGKPLGLESDRARHTHALCQAWRRHWERVSNTLKDSTWNSWVWTKLWEALIRSYDWVF